MSKRLAHLVVGAVLASAGLGASPVAAQGQLVLYCSVQEEWCRGMVTAFERKTGIKVAMTRKSSGETYAQIRAEKDNPKGDVWWGGTGDPHLQAAEEGVTLEYQSPKLAELHDWATRQAQQSKFRTVGIYSRRSAGPICSTRNSATRSRSPTPTRRAPPILCWPPSSS